MIKYQKTFKTILLFIFMVCFLPTFCYPLDPPPITPIDAFFVTNNNGIPTIPDNWHLIVDGDVANPLSLTLENLGIYPAKIPMATLECWGNPFSIEPLIGNATWTGVPLHALIEQVGPLGEIGSIIISAVDGYAIIISEQSLPDALQRDDIILAYRMNDEMLPLEQGYPLRLILPGFLGTFWVQWVERIEITTTPLTNDLITIPLHAQIFKPQNGENFMVGSHLISGMALVGEGREVTKVDVSTDGGVTWQPARLLNYFVPNVWKYWEFDWEISEAGQYHIIARAEDNLGNIQGENGFFGWQIFSITVNADLGCPANEVTYSISGTVTGDVRDEVALTLSGSASSSTTTDSSGNFSFSGLNNCIYIITPSKTGYTFTPSNRTVTINGDNQSGVNFTAVPCTYTISPSNQPFDSSGGTGSVSVTTQSVCSWTVTSKDSWITITSGSSGTGNEKVNYSVSANSSTSSRTGTMTIAGETFTVTQGGGCSSWAEVIYKYTSYVSGQASWNDVITCYNQYASP